MNLAAKAYVESVEGGYRIAGTRVSLDSVIYRYHEGLSPEGIAECFPALSLEQVYGAVAFYLANRVELEGYLRQGEELSRELQRESRQRHADLITRLQRARHDRQISGGR